MEFTEQQQRQLEDLVVNGKAEKTVTILNGLMTLTLVSTTVADQLEIERSMNGIEGTPIFVLHSYAVRSLSRALKSVVVKGVTTEFKTKEEVFDYVASRPTPVIDAMMDEQTKFGKELKILTAPEKLSENFSKTPETVEGSNTLAKV